MALKGEVDGGVEQGVPWTDECGEGLALWSDERLLERVRDDLRQAGTHFGTLAVPDGLDQEFSKRLTVELELAQYVEDLPAERVSSLTQLLQEDPVDIALARLLGHEVPEVADLSLTDPVDAPEALLDAVRI